jgi:hypothetical protein
VADKGCLSDVIYDDCRVGVGGIITDDFDILCFFTETETLDDYSLGSKFGDLGNAVGLVGYISI